MTGQTQEARAEGVGPRGGPADVAAATNRRLVDVLIAARMTELHRARHEFIAFEALNYSALVGADGFVDVPKAVRVINSITNPNERHTA